MNNSLRAVGFSTIVVVLLFCNTAFLRADQHGKAARIASPTVKLLYPPNDTTCICPVNQIPCKWQPLVSMGTHDSYHIQEAMDSLFTNPMSDDQALGSDNVYSNVMLPWNNSSGTVYWRVCVWGQEWSEVHHVNFIYSCLVTAQSPSNGSSYCSGSEILFGWSVGAHEKFTFIHIYQDSLHGPDAKLQLVNGIKSFSWTPTQPGTYVWQLSMTDSAGNSQSSDARRIQVITPGLPQLLSPTSAQVFVRGTDTTVNFHWTASEQASRYILSIAKNGSELRSDTVQLTNSSVPVNSLTPGTYTWKAGAQCSATTPPQFSGTDSFIIQDNANGVEDLNTSSLISVIPQPVNTVARFVFNASLGTIQDLKIINALGQVVAVLQSSDLHNGELAWDNSTQGITSGCYQLIASTSRGTAACLFVVQHE